MAYIHIPQPRADEPSDNLKKSYDAHPLKTKYDDEELLLKYETGEGGGAYASISRIIPGIAVFIVIFLGRFYREIGVNIKDMFEGESLIYSIAIAVAAYVLLFMFIPALIRGAGILLTKPRQEVRFTDKGIRTLPLGNYRQYSRRSKHKDKANIAIDYSAIRDFESDPDSVRIYPKLTISNIFQDTTLTSFFGVPLRIGVPTGKESEVMAILMGRVQKS